MKKLFWIDLEMTGLDVTKEVIIEAAVIITDLDFKELTTYQSVINQPQSFLDKMDDWNQSHHSASGLLEQIPNGQSPQKVEQDLNQILDTFFPIKAEKTHPNDHSYRAVLAGNSIGQDRLFLDKYMPSFSSRLHYRSLDVSSWKIIFQNKYDIKYKKENQHRALDDIRESIEELKKYMEYIQPPQ